jgi:hypothetical protein
MFFQFHILRIFIILRFLMPRISQELPHLPFLVTIPWTFSINFIGLTPGKRFVFRNYVQPTG